MTTAAYVSTHVLPVTAKLLPSFMNSTAAWALVMAIGWQESRFEHRRQIMGPARGFWQFEVSGVRGVLRHEKSSSHARDVLETLGYRPDAVVVQAALEHHDVLAACFARLLLWTDSRILPLAQGAEAGWEIYRATWNPGRPHAETWPRSFAAGWAADVRV